MTTAHPYWDNRILRKECVALAEAGLNVRLVAVAPADHVFHGIDITALPSRRGRAGRMVLGPIDAWRALRKVRPAMIQVHDPELIPMAILWRAVHRRPALYDAHEDLPKQVAGKVYIARPLRGLTSVFARLLECAADVMLNGVVAATPAISRKYRHSCTLVQNFPWLRDFPEPSTRAIAAQGLRLCYVGAITRDRGAIEMLRVTQDSACAPRLVLAGGGSAEIIKEVERDISGRVQYLGLLPAESIPSVIAESDAGLVILHPLPNYLESQPTKLFEYMAAGKPFIASNFPAWERLLGEFDCGYFVDPRDHLGLDGLVRHLSLNTSEANAKGARGRKALTEHFTFEAESKLLVTTTKRLLASPDGSRRITPALIKSGDPTVRDPS